MHHLQREAFLQHEQRMPERFRDGLHRALKQFARRIVDGIGVRQHKPIAGLQLQRLDPLNRWKAEPVLEPATNAHAATFAARARLGVATVFRHAVATKLSNTPETVVTTIEQRVADLEFISLMYRAELEVHDQLMRQILWALSQDPAVKRAVLATVAKLQSQLRNSEKADRATTKQSEQADLAREGAQNLLNEYRKLIGRP